MGVAAYWRGSKAISDGLARDAYREGRSWYDPDRILPKPTPHPPGYGDKAAARAADVAARHIKTARFIAECQERAFQWTQADEDAAVQHLAERHRIGTSTLRAAFVALGLL